MRIACTHPGKMGDTLYALPTIRQIAKDTGSKIDFYTSEYCAPLRRLFEYQLSIGRFYISPGYIIERMDMGVQPYIMPVHPGYDVVYHLGFRRVPNQAIHQFIYKETFGYDYPLAIEYDYPPIDPPLSIPYVCIAPRGETSYKSFFIDLAHKLMSNGVAVAWIGSKEDKIDPVGWDATGKDMLDTLSILAHSKGFVGLMSSQLVLANGFDIPRIAVHDGIHWDMSHVVYTARNHYPINPTTDQTIALLFET